MKKYIASLVILCFMLTGNVALADNFYVKKTLSQLQAMHANRGDRALVYTDDGNVTFYSHALGTWTEMSRFSKLGAGTFGSYQPLDAMLTALAALTTTQGSIVYFSAADTPVVLAKGTAYQGLQMNSGATAPAWASGESLLSSTTLDLSADGNTTIFTVPAGRTAVLTKAYLVAAADAGTTTLTIGQAGALTDFLGTQTLSAIDAAGDVGFLSPIPHATTPKIEAYAAGTVIKAVVGSHAGAAGNTLHLFGFVY